MAATPRSATLLVALLFLYGAASLLHFAHNAEFLGDYPNMPGWLSRAQVYCVWLGVTAIGLCGYVLTRRGDGVVGLLVIGLYAAFGFDGLAHYSLAPVAAHTATMHVTIGLEVVAAALLLAAVVARVAKLTLARRRSGG